MKAKDIAWLEEEKKNHYPSSQVHLYYATFMAGWNARIKYIKNKSKRGREAPGMISIPNEEGNEDQ